MDFEEQIAFLIPGWNEKATELALSSVKKGHKSENLLIDDNQQYSNLEGTSLNEKGYKSAEDLPNKKIWYLIVVLFMLGTPLSIDELMSLFEYSHKGKFRDNYVKPLESVGFITKTNPDKPTASNQKYVITEKGKRFLTGQEF